MGIVVSWRLLAGVG